MNNAPVSPYKARLMREAALPVNPHAYGTADYYAVEHYKAGRLSWQQNNGMGADHS